MKTSYRKNSILLIFIFFFSGFAALIYQVIWQRWLVFYTGISSVSISLIVSAFMAGLGLGYLVGGQLADRVPKNRPIVLFFLAEIGIGLFALVSKYIIYDWLYLSSALDGSSNLQVYAILFLVLLFPTFLMGLSLPLLSKSFEEKTAENQASFISLLYFTNTLGAAIGTFITSFYLIPKLGFEKSVQFGAILNFICGFTALYVYYDTKKREKFQKNKIVLEDNLASNSQTFSWKSNFSYWIIQYTLSGFMAISFEIIWFRMIDTMMKSYAVTFSIILAIYLGSMAVGTYVGVLTVKKIKTNKLKFFLNAQYFLYFYTAFSIFLLHYVLNNTEILGFLTEYFKGYDTVESRKIKVITMILIPLFLMSVPTFIMGYSFTLSQVIIQDKFEEVGRKVGWLQFMNIVGSTLGAWFATLVGFEYLGSALTIKIICLIGLIYIVVLFKNKSQSVLTSIGLAVILLLSIYFIPKQEQFWMNLSGMKNAEDFVFHEDETALSSIKIEGEKAEVFINGLGQSILPIFHDYIHFMLGAVPAFVHPNPEDIGIIGLGSGSTLFNSGGRELTKTLDCFEVIVNQPIVLNEYVKRTKDSAAHFILNDKRVNLFLEDGRNALFRSNKLYDIVEADALRPRSSYSGNLYSVEYFTMLKSKLKKGGIAISWVPSDRIRNGFMRVFPYVYEIQETLFLGSETPIEFDTETILNRIENDYSRNYYAKAKVDVKGIMINSLKTLKVIQSGTLTTTGEHNSDMWPRDEYQRR